MTITLDSSSTGCSLSGAGVVSFTAVGNCVIDANQGGNGSYNPAPPAQESIAVTAASLEGQTISFTTTAPTSATVGGATYSPAAMATSGLPVTITLDSSSNGCSLSGAGVVSFTGFGPCVIDANQGGNGTYGPPPSAADHPRAGEPNHLVHPPGTE